MNKTLLNIKKAIATITLLLVFPILFSGCNSYLDKYVDPETGKLNANAAPISLLKRSSIKTLINTDSNVFYLMNDITGSVYVTGSNEYGLLGQGTYSGDSDGSALRANLPERIKLIDASETRAAAVSDTNKVYIWGDLSAWGITPEDTKETMYKVFSFDTIVTDISVGENHIALLTKDGSAYTLGTNLGQLGYDIFTNLGEFYPDFRKIETSAVFSIVDTNATATYFLSGSGELYGSSANEYCELGYVGKLSNVNKLDTVKPIKAISTCKHSLFALASDGTVYACGENANGVLGLNSSLPFAASLTMIPFDAVVTQISASDTTPYVHFVTEDEKLYACGTNLGLNTQDKNQSVIAPSLVNVEYDVSEFYGNGSARFFVDSNGRLYAYGQNQYAQIPDVDRSDRFITDPIRIYLRIK